MNPLEQIPEVIVRSAIEWQMRLRANPGSAELDGRFQQWLRRDERHQVAWQRLRQMGELFESSQLPSAAQAIPVLQQAGADLNRRRSMKLLGLGVVAGSAALLDLQVPPAWHADFATTIGERRRIPLGNDGLTVQLNTGSAVDAQGRELYLRAGEALIEGDDWRAHCRFATCEGRHASVLLHERDGSSDIRVQRGEALVTVANGSHRLQAGEGLRVSASGSSALGRGPVDPFAWVRGLLIVSDIRLAEFVSEAGRYRQGWLGCDSAIANLRLSGVFRLDDPAAMLDNLTHLLPVRVVERTRWWVRIAPVA